MADLFSRWFGRRPGTAPIRDLVELLAPLAAPAIRIIKTSRFSTRSHFGGAPQLPTGVNWPENQGQKLGFLARLSLAEIHRALAVDWLPTAGALLFFYDVVNTPWGSSPEERGRRRVLLVPDLPASIGSSSSEAGEASFRSDHYDVCFERFNSFPPPEREVVKALQLSKQELRLYDGMLGAMDAVLPMHQISGWPRPWESDDMEAQCQSLGRGHHRHDPADGEDPQSATLAPGASNWKLLFHFDARDDLGLKWNDHAMFYFWVEEHAARAGDFDDVWLTTQVY